MALGAQTREVLRLVVGEGLRLTMVGVAIGIAGARAVTRAMPSLLFDITNTDPLTYAAVSAVLVAVAAVASYLPAQRASRVDQAYLIAVAGGGGTPGQAGTVSDIVELTGGRRFFARSPYELEEICTEIAIEIKNQYVIGYRSTNENRDGKYRKISLKVKAPKGMTQMFVRAKTGYYGPSTGR